MKKLMAMLLALGCMTGLAACGGAENNGGGSAAGDTADSYAVEVYNQKDLSDEQKKAVIGTLDYEAPDSELGDASVTRVVSVNEFLIALYPEFDDPDKAIETTKEKCSKVLEFLKKQYDLEEFSDSSWETYREKMWDCFDDGTDLPKWYTEDNDEIMLLDSFFDLYEDISINDDLIAQAQEKETMLDLLNSDFVLSIPGETREQLIEQYTETYGSDGLVDQTAEEE